VTTFGHALLTHNVKPDDGQETRRVEAGGGNVTYSRVSIHFYFTSSKQTNKTSQKKKDLILG
jgi:hypothetical protein